MNGLLNKKENKRGRFKFLKYRKKFNVNCYKLRTKINLCNKKLIRAVEFGLKRPQLVWRKRF